MKRHQSLRWAGALGRAVPSLLGVALLLGACGGSTPARTASTPGQTAPTASRSAEKPVPAESNPPGDIPDTTLYVSFRSSKGGFAVKTPEGWSQITQASTISFTDKLNTIAVTWSAASSAPTTASVNSNQVPALRSSERAFVLGKVLACAPTCSVPYPTGAINVHLQAGNAVALTYQVNSDPNPVTGKQYRLEVVRFDFYRNGEEADLILSGPVGSDNVDPWRLIAQSFQWS